MRLTRRRLLAAALLLPACAAPPQVQVSDHPVRIELAPAPTARPRAAGPVPAARPTEAAAKDDGSLQRDLGALLGAQQGGAYALAIRDLSSPLAVSYQSDDRFPLGSLFKLMLMYEVYRQVRLGALALDTPVQTIDDYSFPEPPGGIPPSTRVPIQDALMAMITVSSNAAALALIEAVHPGALESAPQRLGLKNTAIEVQQAGEPGHYAIDARGSAADVLDFLVRLDREQLVGQDQDRRMIDLLLKQQIDDRLPRLLPKDVPIAHKTADLDGFTHDAGIVYLPGRPFAIAVLAEGPSPTEGKALVAEIGRLAYSYFSSRR